MYRSQICLGTKLGMTRIFDGQSDRPVTICRVRDNIFRREVRGIERDGIGSGCRAFSGLFSYEDNGIRVNKEFPIIAYGEDAEPSTSRTTKAGEQISFGVDSFEIGMNVNVSGKSRGKGFEGPIKIWGFSMIGASHGVSATHRSHGSTGQRQDPGKVFKGKKMARRHGGKNVKIKGLTILDVNKELGIVAISGAIPGANGSLVKIEGNFSF